MESCLRIALLLFLVSGTLTQEFDLGDALDDLAPAPTPAKPKEKPKVQDGGGFGLDLEDALGPDPNPKPKPADNPPKSGGGGGDFNLDLGDALGPDPTPKPTVKPPKSGGGGGGGDFGLDLEDALGPDPNPKPKPADNPPKSGGGGGGGNFDDSTLFDVSNGDYKPEGGNSGGRAVDPGYNEGGADQPQEAGGGQIAAIVSAVGVALMGAASSYFAYQKKKLCFKIQGGQDPESGKGYQGTQSNPQSDPQVFSNLLRT